MPPKVTKYVDETLQNVTYDSPEHVLLRTENFFSHTNAERAINAQARKAMSQPDSSIARQSTQVAHLIRGIWAKADLDPSIREQLNQEILDRNNVPENSLSKGVSIFEKDLNAMFVRAEEGPLTFKQSQFGIEVAYVLRALSKELKPHSNLLSMLYDYSSRVNVPPSRAGTHHFKDEHGVNLSKDLGSKVRDELGLPVMLGTSGSGSNAASAARFASDYHGVSLWADGLTEEQGRMALIDAVFHFMREQVVPVAMKPEYDAMRIRNGAKPKTVDPFMVFTHTYPEVSSAVEMTLNEENKKDELAMRRSSERARQRLNLLHDDMRRGADSAAQSSSLTSFE